MGREIIILPEKASFQPSWLFGFDILPEHWVGCFDPFLSFYIFPIGSLVIWLGLLEQGLDIARMAYSY